MTDGWRTTALLVGLSVLVSVIGIGQLVLARRLGVVEDRIGGVDSRKVAPARNQPLPSIPVSIAQTATKGDPAAEVAVVVYSDFQCPYCGVFAKVILPELERRYISTGQVLLAFKHLPIETLHPEAFGAAQAAQCAGGQGHFWPMHDALFSKPKDLHRSSLQLTARALGLDEGEFDRCMGGEVASELRREISEARTLSIAATPTFLVGTLLPGLKVKVTYRFSGAKSAEQFGVAIDTALNESSGRSK